MASWWAWLTASAERPFCVFLLAVVLSGCLWRAANYDGKLEEKAAAVAKKRDDLQGAIHNLVSDMEATLRNIMESNAYLAERNFEGKRRDFRRFLKQAAEAKHLFDPPEVVALFRAYALQWVAVFAECSIEEAPAMDLIPSSKLEECDTVSQVALCVMKWLERKEVRLVEETLKKYSVKSWEKKTETPTQPTTQRLHMLSLGSFFAGASLTAVAALHGDAAAAVAACMAALMSPFAFVFTQSRMARLTEEIKQLKEQKEAVKSRSKEVMDFFGILDRRTSMWQLRTVPHLDLLKEVHDAIWFIPQEQVREFLVKAVANLDLVVQALGPQELWYGELALSENELQVISSQLADDQGGISRKQARRTRLDLLGRVKDGMAQATLGRSRKELTAKELHAKVDDWVPIYSVSACFGCEQRFSRTSWRKNCHRCGNVFCKPCASQKMPVPKLGYVEPSRVCKGCAAELQEEQLEEQALAAGPAIPTMLCGVTVMSFLSVRVVAAFSLRSCDVGTAPNAYIRLRVSETAEWVKTATVRGEANPTWSDEEFFFAVRGNDTTLMAQVVNESASHSLNSLAFLGSMDVKFRTLPSGEWTPLAKPLEGRKQGALELMVRFAEDAWHLL